MRTKTVWIALALMLILLTGCNSANHTGGDEFVFQAKILQVNGNAITVEPVEGEDILRSSDCITFDKSELDDIGASVGAIVNILYVGGVRDSYPAQIDARSWSLIEPSPMVEGNAVIPDNPSFLSSWKPLADLPFDYGKEQAIADGVYVNIHGMEIYNQALVDTFYKDALHGIAAFMRTVEYTVEGDPIITDYQYNGSIYTVASDISRDKFKGTESEDSQTATYKYLLPFGRSRPRGGPQLFALSNEENIYTGVGSGEVTLIDGLGRIPSPSDDGEWLQESFLESWMPPLSGVAMKDANELADAFINALNAGHDLTGIDNAKDSWLDVFDFGQMPVHSGGLYEVENNENLFQFDVIGKDYNGDVVPVTVLINLQGEEPWFYCAYIYYQPYARSTAEEYIRLLANGDSKQLAKWLSVDGGPEPGSDFIRQAKLGLLKYGSFDLESARVTEIRYSNDRKRFICEAEDMNGGSFEILLSYGDGLIMPERLD